MESLLEALPEFVIAILLTGAFFWLSKDRVSLSIRLKVVFSVALLERVDLWSPFVQLYIGSQTITKANDTILL